MSSERYDRVGAICGIAFVVLVVITFFLPATPEIDDPIAEAIADVRDDEDGIMASVYLGGLAAIVFLPFLGVLYGLLRRAEAARSGFSVAALVAGAVTTAGVVIGNGVIASVVAAVDEDYDPQAVEALLALDNTVFLGTAFAFAAFYLAVAVVILATRALPRWLGWAAVVIGVLIVVGLLGVFSEESDGGPLGFLVFIGFLAGLLWTLAVSIVILTRSRRAGTADLPAAEPL
jgi:hypothetical protein